MAHSLDGFGTTGGHWVGREVVPELHERALRAGFEVIAPDTDFSTALGAGQLDLLVAFDVLEHLDLAAIRTFLNDAKTALRSGGLLLIRIPSGDSPYSGAIYRGDLTHRTLLGSSAVRQLALEAGLSVVQLRSPVLPIRGLGPLRAVRRLAVIGVQTVSFAFVGRVLMGNSQAVVSPDMVAVLRKESR